jgi:hypothetical protein
MNLVPTNKSKKMTPQIVIIIAILNSFRFNFIPSGTFLYKKIPIVHSQTNKIMLKGNIHLMAKSKNN